MRSERLDERAKDRCAIGGELVVVARRIVIDQVESQASAAGA